MKEAVSVKKVKKTPETEKTKDRKAEEPAETLEAQEADVLTEAEDAVEEAQAVEEPDPIEALNQEISELNKQLEESKESLLWAYADTDNTRKRLIREAETAKKYRFQSAAMELLPILDNLNRALDNAPEGEETANFVKGFEMIRTQFLNALSKEGVQEIEALNKPFDAAKMQALMTEKREGVEPGTVLEVLQNGYTLKDRILRPALVKVSE